MPPSEPPPPAGPILTGDCLSGPEEFVFSVPQVPVVNNKNAPPPPPVGSLPLPRGPFLMKISVPVFIPVESVTTTTTTNTETKVSVFKTGSLSLRKDMMARLPAMHSPNFKSNLQDLEQSTLLINELNLNSTNTNKLNLGEGALRVLNTPNAGGNSVWSEVLSIELLSALYGAKLLRTEMEIEYMMRGSITDYSVTVADATIGVSVTRAMEYRGQFLYEDALALMTKKLRGVLLSSENVCEEDKWVKQVLHVWVQEPYMVNIVQEAYNALPELWGNTLVQLTVCGANMGWIFK